MNPEQLKDILENVRDGNTGIDEAMEALKYLPYRDLGHTRIDEHRELRKGCPEVIFCAGKTVQQVKEIVSAMLDSGANILATRVSEEMFATVKGICYDAVYSETAGTITIQQHPVETTASHIAIITAGTSDMPVAEEAAVTAVFFGNRVDRIYDIGVAGVHRLFDMLGRIREARVIVVIAGMEGALPGIVAGLVDKPVIAVPTSVGYGASFNGLAALLGMLNSCAGGIGVVNIDNGFGAGYLAGMINSL